MKQVVQIIGGQHRGRKISFPPALGLRPTPSRIRETLFNWLMHDIQNAHCLDAFAGSGALGFEAFSRGAHSVIFIEKLHAPFLYLQKQIKNFDSQKLMVIENDILNYLNHTQKQFDIIFLDAPFKAPHLLEKAITIIEKKNSLSPNGMIYTESASPVILSNKHWQTLKEKKAGFVYYALHQRQLS